MNYIKQLEGDKDDLKAVINAVLEEIKDFNRLLNSSKHNGVDSNGERLDYISTDDVLRRVQAMKNILNGIGG